LTIESPPHLVAHLALCVRLAHEFRNRSPHVMDMVIVMTRSWT
jgi:hypothetical protein